MRAEGRGNPVNVRATLSFGTALISLLLIASSQIQAQGLVDSGEAISDPEKTFRVTAGFRGQLPLETKAGKQLTLQTAVHSWSIDGSFGWRTVRTSDFTVFHLRAGKLQVLVNGVEELKRADAFWTSPAGATLKLRVKGETAVLDTLTVAPK
jgi:hypothetical protein